MTELRVTLAAIPGPATAALLSGEVSMPGVSAAITRMHPSELFWRQLRYAEFDISELSLSSLLIAISKGDRTWTPLPIFTSRRFFHTDILVRSDADIDRPEDLAGKRVGVPEYQQTAAVWVRLALLQEFGVHPAEIEWYMERAPDKSHGGATGFSAPPGVRISVIPEHLSIAQMLESGELDAAAHYVTGGKAIDRSTYAAHEIPRTRALFPDSIAEASRYHVRTGLLPMNHCVVIRSELVRRSPDIVMAAFDAFSASKRLAVASAQRLYAPAVAVGVVPPDALERDPLPFRLTGQELLTAQTLADYLVEEGLAARRLECPQIFADIGPSEA